MLDAVVLGPDRTARVLLRVAPGDDPVLPQRREPPADVGPYGGVGVRARGVVQRDRPPVGEVHLTDRHPQIGARALDVRLVPADGRPGLPAAGLPPEFPLRFPPVGSLESSLAFCAEAGVRVSLMVMRPTPYAGITR